VRQNRHNRPQLTRRERQIMDIVYRAGRATAMEIHAALPDPPTYSAVRAKLAVLEQKDHLKHQEDGPRYVYLPAVPHDRASRSALRHLLDTFFGGSAANAAAALLDPSVTDLSEAELESLSHLIEKARKETRR
jgi:BlaI family transcriptional regulator, penicillinase repressor